MSDESLDSLSNVYDGDENFAIVKVDALRKCFPQAHRVAVNNVQFNLYENQITALLGHNGAGGYRSRTDCLRLSRRMIRTAKR